MEFLEVRHGVIGGQGKFRLAGTLIGALAVVGLANSPALAATDVTVYGETVKSGCAHSGIGHFASYGEVFTVYDECKDGWSAVLKVDVAPLHTDGGYDFSVWNNNGADGSPVTTDRSYAEGTKVCLSEGAGLTDDGEWGQFSNWSCGKA